MSPRQHRVHLKPAYSVDHAKGRSGGHGAFLMALDDGLEIGVSDEPFFAAARWLLKNGFAEPEDVLETVHAHGTVAMRGKVGEAAQWTIRETRGGQLVRRRHEPFSGPGGANQKEVSVEDASKAGEGPTTKERKQHASRPKQLNLDLLGSVPGDSDGEHACQPQSSSLPGPPATNPPSPTPYTAECQSKPAKGRHRKATS